VFFNPPWEFAKHMACHFKRCKRTTPTSTMMFLFFLSGLSSTPSFVTVNCSRNFILLGLHMCLLASWLLTRLNKRLLRRLHGRFDDFGWSTLIVIFTIQPRQQICINLPWYQYHQTNLHLPSLRYDDFLGTLPPC
jgi:glucan phosphoethanolaminetransferase (alkaline phosphatase superfamily)